MKNVLVKDFFAEIKNTLSRFLSIMLIVALGAGVFVGVKTASPSMKYSADKFFKDNNLMDFRVVSDYGFKDKDVEEIEKIKGIAQVMPSYSSDLFIDINGTNKVVKVYSLPESKDKDEKPINNVKVIEGRLPQNKNECVVESTKAFKIGDEINFSSPREDVDINTIIKEQKFKIVGFIESPQYISFEKGISMVGDGTISYYMMVLPEAFSYERYTEVYITVDKDENIATFEDKYTNLIAEYTPKIEDLSKVRLEENYEEILATAKEKLDNGKKDLEDKKNESLAKLNDAEDQINKGKEEIASNEQKLADAENKLLLARKEIDDNKIKLDEAEAQLSESEQEFNKQITAAETEIKNRWNSYNEGLAEYNKKNEEFQSKKIEAENQIAQGKESLKEIENTISALEEVYRQVEESNRQDKDIILSELGKQIDELRVKYNDAQAQITEAEAQLSEGESQLAAAKGELDVAKATLENAEEELRIQKENGLTQMEQAKQDIASGRQQITTGEAQYKEGQGTLEEGRKQLEEVKQKIEDAQKEYDKGKNEFDTEFASAEQTLKNKEKEVEELDMGKWYIFDREDNPGYTSYLQDANRINGIASIFPLFFLIVAALVCLTTMTRMVEEKRTQIGTLKALGYDNITIIAKYFFYAFIAAIVGSVLGIIVGVNVLPKVIFQAYNAMYTLPYNLDFSYGVVVIAIICSLLCTCTVTSIVAGKALKENATTLMRPKAPKIGKRIWLEKISFIWNHLNFSSKVTARNIFRYKARFIMTVLGVAGCTALILSAYGLRDSISVVVPKQYGEIFNYDMLMACKYEGTFEEQKSLVDLVEQDNRIKDKLLSKISTVEILDENSENIQIKLFVPESIEKLPKYIKLNEPDNGKEIKFTNESVVITQKFASLLDIKEGDTIKLEVDSSEIELKVTDITENYVYNYVYISPELYNSVTGNEVKYNSILTKISDEGKKAESAIANDWLEKDEILVVNFNSDAIKSFNDVIKSLDSIVYIMIICAAALAFIVVYNLTNINVAERMREIATIKVLGFSDIESANYIYRENILLSIIGIIGGLIAGVFLSNYIVATIEMDIVIFGREINLLSFVYATAFTLIFTLLVNAVMYNKINKISMVESLKSVE